MERMRDTVGAGRRWGATARSRAFGTGVAAFAMLCAVMATSAEAKRVALVIGNAAYTAEHAELKNSVNDARAMAQVLEELGFEVETELDASRAGMLDALTRFAARSEGANVALVFYAGTGFKSNGVNYLVPVDAGFAGATAAREEAVSLAVVLEAMSGAQSRVAILDMARDSGPLAVTPDASGSDPLETAVMERALVAFAGAAGALVSDGEGRNSPYTVALLEHLRTPGVEIRTMLGRVAAQVDEVTDGAQRPEFYSSLAGELYLAGVEPRTVPSQSRQREPAGLPAVFRDCAECPTMVVTPAGESQMGSPSSEEGRTTETKARSTM